MLQAAGLAVQLQLFHGEEVVGKQDLRARTADSLLIFFHCAVPADEGGADLLRRQEQHEELGYHGQEYRDLISLLYAQSGQRPGGLICLGEKAIKAKSAPIILNGGLIVVLILLLEESAQGHVRRGKTAHMLRVVVQPRFLYRGLPGMRAVRLIHGCHLLILSKNIPVPRSARGHFISLSAYDIRAKPALKVPKRAGNLVRCPLFRSRHDAQRLRSASPA